MIRPGYAEYEFMRDKKIVSLDLADKNGLINLSAILSDNDAFRYLCVYKKISALSYAELDGLLARARNIPSAEALVELIERMMIRKENEGIFLLMEDIIINNTPVLSGSPFYGKSKEGLKAAALEAHAERFYFDNLRLKHRKNILLSESGKLWVNPKALSGQRKSGKNRGAPPRGNTGFTYEKLAKKADKIWSYRLRGDNLNDFYFGMRQWVKRYKEDLTDAPIIGEAAIIRNEYRIFCVDILSGREIWSFGGMDKNRREFTHSLRHPHQNSYGNELLLNNNIIFSELDGKLVAVSIKDLFFPLLLWEVSLGEYSAASRPIQAGAILVVTLINAKGELWACGFDSQKGSLEWSTYIGTSSFLSPVCRIHSIINGKVLIGTNHGILACLNYLTGEVIWLRKYTPKDYGLCDYWLCDYWFKGYHKDKVFNTGSIEYDTQFLDSAGNQAVYYKARESDYFYVLEQETGRLKEEVLIDPEKLFLLGTQNNKAVFLKKKGLKGNNMEVKVVELNSGKQLFDKLIPSGELHGVIRIDESGIAFKARDRIHFLMTDSDNIIHREVVAKTAGWLLSFKDGFMIIKDGSVISCIDLFQKKYRINKNDPEIAGYLNRIESAKLHLQLLLASGKEDSNSFGERKNLLEEFREFRIPLAEIFPIIVKNLQKAGCPEWKEFFAGLTNLYGKEVINYRGIDMQFSNLMYEKFPGPEDSYGKSDQRAENKHSAGNDFLVRADTVVPVPIKVIKGFALPGYFLMANNDQLICAAEDGDILWERKIFASLGWKMLIRDSNIVPYDATTIKAYLYDDTLIINDGVDLLAVKAFDGSYLWSMTNHGELIAQGPRKPFTGYSHFEKYNLRGAKFENKIFYTGFFDDSLLVANGNKVYLINPLTGYCKDYCQLEGVTPIGVQSSGDRILIFTVDRLKVLNKELTLIGDLAFDASGGDKDKIPDLTFAKEINIIKIDSRLYKLDLKNISLKDISPGDREKTYLDSFEEKILILSPFRKLTAYRLEGGKLKTTWAYNVEPTNAPLFWKSKGRASEYYFITGGRLLMPIRKSGDYFIVCIDLRTGKQLWEQCLKGVDGLFYNLSDFVNNKGKVGFIISTVDCKHNEKRIELLDEESMAGNVYINSSLFWLDAASGRIVKNEKLPAICFMGYKNANITESESLFLYGINGNTVRACKK